MEKYKNLNTKINWWNISLGEEEIAKVADAIRSKCISQGKITSEFEKKLSEYLGVPYTVCTTSGTTAILSALIALGIKPNDEIIVADRTFIATVNPALLLGSKLNLVDVKNDKEIIDEKLIEKEISKNTKAIIATHINGNASEMDTIIKVAEDYKIPVIEDACQAFGSKYKGKYLGGIARFGCFSLGMAKIITTGQGGFTTCHNEVDYIALKKIRNQGVLEVHTDNECYDSLGMNFKFTDMQAAIGLVQLSKINDKKKHQITIFNMYKEGLKNVKGMKIIDFNLENGELPLRPNYLCTEREKLLKYLEEKNIHAIAQLPSLSEAPHIGTKKKFTNSLMFSKHLVTLPCGPSQLLENVKYVINTINDISLKSW
jgi:perosamine synthetase